MDLGLNGKRALVTGGSLGIGKAIALELAREGVDVAIVARTKDRLEAAASELASQTGRTVVPLVADVTSREQVDRAVAQAAERLGGLHILVNSGSAPGGSASATGPIETVVDEDLLQDFNVKYVGALRCARAAIPYLKQQGWGRIINISGTNARNAGNLSGGARTGSLVRLTKPLAVHPGRRGAGAPPAGARRLLRISSKGAAMADWKPPTQDRVEGYFKELSGLRDEHAPGHPVPRTGARGQHESGAAGPGVRGGSATSSSSPPRRSGWSARRALPRTRSRSSRRRRVARRGRHARCRRRASAPPRAGPAQQDARRAAGGLAVLQGHLPVDDGDGDPFGLLNETASPAG